MLPIFIYFSADELIGLVEYTFWVVLLFNKDISLNPVGRIGFVTVETSLV